jgi:taurine--2-oxoglutarate transaminase
MPLGATVVSDRIADYFDNNYLPTGLTNFAHPISCAAALAAIEVYESEGLIENARKMGQLLDKELNKLSSRHDSIGSYRGKGLFYAIEFVDPINTNKRLVEWEDSNYYKAHPKMKRLINNLKKKGLFTYSRFNVLFIAPPLCINRTQLLTALEIISEIISDSIEH